MSMSTHVVGFVAPTEDYLKKLAAWQACKAAGVRVPEELEKFFEKVQPDPLGIEVQLKDAVSPYRGRESEGFQVDLSKLPPGVTHIRFWNLW